MKELSTFISLSVLILVTGYIVYSENRKSPVKAASTKPTNDLAIQSFALPAKLSFAGEPIPLHITDVRERMDRELQINAYLHSSTLFIMKRAHRWLPPIEKILQANNIPEDFKYLPLIESALLNATSPKEAVGFWQILESSGKSYGLEITTEVDERYDPLQSTQAACLYLKDAYNKFGSWTLAAASYNRGMSGMQKALNSQKVNSYYDLFLNDETSRYLFRMVAMKEILENEAKYGFSVSNADLYQPEPTRYVEVKESIKNLADFALAQGTNYKTLKRLNPWLRDEKLTVRLGRKYRLLLPLQQSDK
jgi:membrane-bound lytic murein transglycosylase D